MPMCRVGSWGKADNGKQWGGREDALDSFFFSASAYETGVAKETLDLVLGRIGDFADTASRSERVSALGAIGSGANDILCSVTLFRLGRPTFRPKRLTVSVTALCSLWLKRGLALVDHVVLRPTP